jgi:divalent metal cation (Fe/Co/Zn/Cd) transporter
MADVDPSIALGTNPTRARDLRYGRRVEFLSIAWTALEAGVGILIAILASSVALLAFGIDSLIEVFSSVIILWRLSDAPENDEREELAHRLVGICFLALALFICVDSLRDLVLQRPPRATYFGIIYSAACIIVMPLLARAKRRASTRLHSNALHADSHQSDICAYLSIILVAGLALNAFFGWWWADPAAALCMVPIIVREGVNGLRCIPCTHHH